MSLSRTIDRLARAIKKEAARNPEFAGRLDAILVAHTSRRAQGGVDLSDLLADGDEAGFEPAQGGQAPAALDINPVAIVSAHGTEALAEALAPHPAAALRALAVEHNLDPAGELADADQNAAIAHIVAAALRRLERDRKLFDY